MPADLNNPIPGIPTALLKEAITSSEGDGKNIFAQNFFPGLNKAVDIFANSQHQKNQQNQIAQLLQQLRGGQPQMFQGMSQQQAPMPNPMQQSIGNNSTMMNNDPLGLFGGQ